ncbi:unnamed protein product [Rhizophagus irregularis]|nr:unnamed protein product [Rhizophagus irregularis]
MACTKIFSGDLPEITNEIMRYFRDDFSTLYSCILVNRLWCRLAIPLLWEDPFSLKNPKNYRYIEVYLYNLNDDDKIQLNGYGISNNLFPSNTLFNYSSFIQHLDTRKVSNSIEKWVSTIFINNTTQNLDFIKFIHKLLIKIFDENEATLHTLYVTYKGSYRDTIVSELVLRSSSFICNVRNLYLKINKCNATDINPFLNFLSSNCNSISSLDFLFSRCYQKFEKKLCNIIDSQQNLKKISLNFNSLPLYHSLLSSKNPNFTNTLRTIIFYHINFENIVVSNEIFKQLNVLESIHILYCYSLDSFQQITNLTDSFKLKSLFMAESFTESLPLLLQKSGDYLENFGLELLRQEQKILELIIKYYSKKIKFLNFCELEDQNIYKIFQLIEKVELSLNYLTIDTNCNVNLGSIVLQYLGQILPSKLEYLNLILIIKPNDFKTFLKNLQNTFIKKLLINNIEKEEQEDILSYIKEYIMKKKRSEYLALLECFTVQSYYTEVDLYSLKDEVKEFRLHNIIVQNYNDLDIETHKFIHEMY